jgi:hypothetical protein
VSTVEETGLCQACGGELTTNEDQTFWQCTNEACALVGQPQVPVTEEDRATIGMLDSAYDVWDQLFGEPAPEAEQAPADSRRRWPFGRR